MSDERISRRTLFTMAGAVGTSLLAATEAEGVDCVVTPGQTEGPYFIDTRLHRSDIRSDVRSGRVREGVPLRLRILARRFVAGRCTPIERSLIDVWHCDAHGAYSGFEDFNGHFDARGETFLRGYQLTDAQGAAHFTTIYPGWYPGRAVHIHLKVRMFSGNKRAHELTSQLYFDDAVTDRVHALPPYEAKGGRDRRNDRDGIFRSRGSGSDLLLRLRPEGRGYLGMIAVGLDLRADR